MTKVLKLLGGGWLAAVLGIVLFAAFSGLLNYDSGTTAATPNFDRASAHVTGADLAPASLANNTNPIRYLPGDITATSRVANTAGPSNPLEALPINLTRAVDALAGSLSPFYDSHTPGEVSAAVDAKGTINNDNMFLNALARDMTSNTVNVSRVPATDLVANVSGDTVQIIDPYVPAVLAGRGSVLDYDNLFGASTAPTHEAWYQAISTTALSNSAFLVLGLVALFAAAFVAMWTSDGFVATNHRAVRAIGAG